MDNETIYIDENGQEKRGWVIDDRTINDITELHIVDNPNHERGGIWVKAQDCYPANYVPHPSQQLCCFI